MTQADKPGRGGSRPGNPNGKRGGARTGTGPTVRRLQLSPEAAQELRILALARLGAANAAACEALTNAFIHRMWLEYDAEIQSAAEKFENIL